jgi:hypothetical protein
MHLQSNTLARDYFISSPLDTFNDNKLIYLYALEYVRSVQYFFTFNRNLMLAAYLPLFYSFPFTAAFDSKRLKCDDE